MYQIILFTDVTDTTMVYKSIGAYKCAHELRRAGYSVLVIDNLHVFTQEDFQKALDHAMGAGTFMLGFSTTFLMNSNVERTEHGTFFTAIEDSVFFPQGPEFARRAIDHARSINPQCRIVVGGAKTHSNWQNKLTDFVILGFAEQSIVDLAHHLHKGSALPNAYKNIWGCTVIDDKAAADYDFQHNDFEWLPEDVIGSRVLPIEISRGCIFKCKFCSFPLIGKKNNDYIRDSERLYQELKNNYEQFGVRYYYILDDTFNDNRFKLEQLLAAVRRLDFQPIFWAYTRLDLVARDHSNFQLLYDIGVRGYYFGIETLDPTAGKIIGKGYDKEKMIDAIRIMRDRYDDVLMHGSFIIGLPEESLDSCRNTFERIMSQDIPLHSFNFKGLMLFNDDKVTWNSELSVNFDQYGYESIPETQPGNRIDINWQNRHTNRDQASQLSKEFNRVGQNSDMYHIPGQVVWGFLNYGQDFDQLKAIKYRDINWAQAESMRADFVAKYKHNLLEFLSNKT